MTLASLYGNQLPQKGQYGGGFSPEMLQGPGGAMGGMMPLGNPEGGLQAGGGQLGMPLNLPPMGMPEGSPGQLPPMGGNRFDMGSMGRGLSQLGGAMGGLWQGESGGMPDQGYKFGGGSLGSRGTGELSPFGGGAQGGGEREGILQNLQRKMQFNRMGGAMGGPGNSAFGQAQGQGQDQQQLQQQRKIGLGMQRPPSQGLPRPPMGGGLQSMRRPMGGQYGGAMGSAPRRQAESAY